MTEEPTFVIKFDGGDADAHTIDMRQLGESLRGIDRIFSDLMIAVSAGRIPRKGERAPLAIKAYEPRPGTVTIASFLQEDAGLLQLGWQLFGASASEMISSWFKVVVDYWSGRRGEAEQGMQHLANIAMAQQKTADLTEEHRHQEMMGMQDILRTVVGKLGPSTTEAVSPVGRSVRNLWLFAGRQPRLTVDEKLADEIRAKADLEWTRLESWTLKTDGFVFHTRRLSIAHPLKSGWFAAEVEDPVAEVEANPYAAAAQRKATILVTAKAAYRAGELERLVIVDFSEETVAAA